MSNEAAAQGLEASCRAAQRAKGTDLSRLWIPEEAGCRLQEGVLSFKSGMVQEEHLQENLDPGKLRIQKRLTVACRRMTRCAGVASLRRGIVRKDCTRANVVQEIRRGQIFGRRHQPKLECSKGIRSRDVEQPLHLRKGRKTANSIGGRSRRQQPQLERMGNSSEIFRKTIGLEFRKRYETSKTGHCGKDGYL
jgi:hypothetical protein